MSQSVSSLPELYNGQVLALRDVPVLSFPEFRDALQEQSQQGGMISVLFGRPQGSGIRLYAVLSHTQTSVLMVCATDVGDEYPALTTDVPQAHWFEREIAEQWGVNPLGHPWLKPIRFHSSYRPGHAA